MSWRSSLDLTNGGGGLISAQSMAEASQIPCMPWGAYPWGYPHLHPSTPSRAHGNGIPAQQGPGDPQRSLSLLSPDTLPPPLHRDGDGRPGPHPAPVTPAHGAGIGFLQPHPVHPLPGMMGDMGTGLPLLPTSGDRDGGLGKLRVESGMGAIGVNHRPQEPGGPVTPYLWNSGCQDGARSCSSPTTGCGRVTGLKWGSLLRAVPMGRAQ